jgi:hypothetical protein
VRQFQQTMTAGQPTPYQQEEFVQRQQEFKEREADRSLDRARLEKSDKEREADRAAAAADRRDAASARNQVAQPGMGTDPKTGEQVFGMHFFDKVKQTDTFVPTSGAVGAGAVSTALREKMNQGKMPDEDTIKGMVGQVKSGQPETEVVPGFSGSGVVGQLRQRIKTDAVKGIMEDHPGMTAEQAGVYLANQRNAYLGSRSSDRQLMTQRGAIYAATQQLDYQLTNAEKVMNQIGGNSTPVLNAIVRGEERWTGDPKYSELFLYMTAATTEAARIMSGGTASAAQLHEGAREEAKHWLDANWTTPQQFASIKKALQGEASNRIENFTGALNYQKMTGTSAGGGPPAASGANDPLGIR